MSSKRKASSGNLGELESGAKKNRVRIKNPKYDQSEQERMDDEELYEDNEASNSGNLGQFEVTNQDGEGLDFSNLELKPDHENRPLWVCPNGRIFLETFSPLYKAAYDFLIAIAEPVCRPECMHEYSLTPHSLYAAVSVGLETSTILSVLNRLSKTQLPDDISEFVKASTQNYGKVKLVLQKNKFFVESAFPEVLQVLVKDDVVKKARLAAAEANQRASEAAARSAAPSSSNRGGQAGGGIFWNPRGGRGGGGGGRGEDSSFPSFSSAVAPRETAAQEIVSLLDQEDNNINMQCEGSGRGGQGLGEEGGGGGASLHPTGGEGSGSGGGGGGAGLTAEPEDRELLSFEIDSAQVEHVKARCLPGGLNFPMLEEYDFKNDTVNPDLNIELKPSARLRPYQEKGLSKMFGNGRARSGIIVLPCGAGKSLTAVAAAARVGKSALVLCTNSVSVDQWRYQFLLWTSLQEHQVTRFTSENKEAFKAGLAGITVSTYNMVAFQGSRSEASKEIIRQLQEREWGLLVMDEVHVVPANMFRKVIGIIKAHCKLGLTATLVREDNLISDLNFLIGPKLYEANWGDLARAGHIANVQCAEVWCPMTKEFYQEYLKKENSRHKQELYVLNPSKIQAAEFLINYHEQQRGDKILVFSDNIFALREVALKLKKPFIYGEIGHNERTRILSAFKHNPNVNTVFISKVGDNSIDIPEANVIIQISSHAGSRRQEAQRLGRILRAKQKTLGVNAAKQDEYNAFFYSLVSKDTVEMYYSTKRQQFLIDQGYSFKVVTNLLDQAAAHGELHYSSKEEQLDLLAKVLASDPKAGEENLGEDVDDLERLLANKQGARRQQGSMQALSGASGMAYMQYKAGGKGTNKPQHHLFKQRQKYGTGFF